MIADLRLAWPSKLFRVALVLAVLYALLRLTIHVLLVVDSLLPGVDAVQSDLGVYLDTAAQLQAREEIYCIADPECLDEPDTIDMAYPYSPTFALTLLPLLSFPYSLVAAGHTVLHLVAYVLLYAGWRRIFNRAGLERARQALTYTAPLWLVFSAFWSDLGYGNVYVVMALLATLLVEAVLEERLMWAALWLTLILVVKPHWAFAAAVPLLLGRYRFFLKLVGLTSLGYVALAGLTMVAVGPAYGWSQYVNYYRFLRWLPSHYPWRLAPDHLGYDHSLRAVVHYILGAGQQATWAALGVRMAALLPLAVVATRFLAHPKRKPAAKVPDLALNLAFALYAGVWLWLDVVWEWTLGIAVFAYVLSVQEHRWERGLAWIAFLQYALLDVWQLAAFIVLGGSVLASGSALIILADPSALLPMTLFLILVFYGLLVKRLWRRSSHEDVVVGSTNQCQSS